MTIVKPFTNVVDWWIVHELWLNQLSIETFNTLYILLQDLWSYHNTSIPLRMHQHNMHVSRNLIFFVSYIIIIITFSHNTILWCFLATFCIFYTFISLLVLLHNYACAGIICTFLKHVCVVNWPSMPRIAEWFEPTTNTADWWMVQQVLHVPDWWTVRLVNGTEQNSNHYVSLSVR